VAVVSMQNKIKGSFDDQDMGALSACVRQVGDDLQSRFRTLLQAAEYVYASSELVTMYTQPPRSTRVDRPTHASHNSNVSQGSREGSLTFAELRTRMDYLGRAGGGDKDAAAVDTSAFSMRGERPHEMTAQQRSVYRRNSYGKNNASSSSPLAPRASVGEEEESLPLIAQ